MKGLTASRFQFLAVFAAAVIVAVVVWAVVAGGPAEPATSGENRIEVFSPAGVATFKGAFRRPW